MTDTTDIKVLRELAETAKVCGGIFAISGEQALSLLDQLEAERQRADKAELELIKPLPIGELIQRLEGQTYEKWFSQSDLKCDQVPVAIDADIIRDANRYRFLRDEDAWGEDSDSWDCDTRTGLISSENLMGGLSPDHFDDAIDARMAASDIPFLNPATAPQKPVGLRQIGSIDHDGGEFAEYFVEFTDSAQVGQAVYVIDSAIEAAGGIVTSDHSGDGDDKVGE